MLGKALELFERSAASTPPLMHRRQIFLSHNLHFSCRQELKNQLQFFPEEFSQSSKLFIIIQVSSTSWSARRHERISSSCFSCSMLIPSRLIKNTAVDGWWIGLFDWRLQEETPNIEQRNKSERNEIKCTNCD